jgi:hypothetical protein
MPDVDASVFAIVFHFVGCRGLNSKFRITRSKWTRLSEWLSAFTFAFEQIV